MRVAVGHPNAHGRRRVNTVWVNLARSRTAVVVALAAVALVGPDGALWILTNNTDGRGTPRAGDDRVARILPP